MSLPKPGKIEVVVGQLQRDQRKSACIIKKRHLTGGEMKEILLWRLEAGKERVIISDWILQEQTQDWNKDANLYWAKQLLEKI